MKSKVISLSAIASAIIAMLLTLGVYVNVVDLVAVVVASVFVVLPLYLKSYKGSILCFLSGGIIAFLLSGFIGFVSIVFPAYFGFLGLYPIVKCKMMEKGVKYWLNALIGLVWCIGIFYGTYFYFINIVGGVFDGLPSWIEKYILYFVGGAGIIFFFVFDRFVVVVKRTMDRYLSRIVK